MPRHDLIAILPDAGAPALGPEMTLVSALGFSAVMTSKPRQVITLPQSRKQVLQAAATRQAQLERLMPFGPVLPVRPGNTTDPDTIAATLRANLPLLHDLTDWLGGLWQYQLTVNWPPDEALRHFHDTPELAPVFGTSPVQAPVLSRAVTDLSNRLRQQMRQILDPVLSDVIAQPVTPEVLLNLAVLIPHTAEAELDVALRQIDAIWSEGFTIRQIGPSPATSFALLDLCPVDRQSLADAHQVLGMGKIYEGDISQARRQALMQPGADAEAIRNAAQVLYASRRAGDPGTAFALLRIASQDQGTAIHHKAAVA